MPIKSFPPVEYADDDGLLAVGGDLSVESLELAYRSGIFPWPIHPRALTWFAPPERTILRLEDFHLSRSLRKELKDPAWSFSTDQAFEEVITHCAKSKNRTGQRGTWITPAIVKAYNAFHRAGMAHSVECWHGGELAGGLYGVAIGKMFAGESMFYLKPNASKIALFRLVEHLREHGAEWLDCQVMTPLLESFGAIEIPRKEFMQLLKDALAGEGPLF